jgi:hypothetical protein
MDHDAVTEGKAILLGLGLLGKKLGGDAYFYLVSGIGHANLSADLAMSLGLICPAGCKLALSAQLAS